MARVMVLLLSLIAAMACQAQTQQDEHFKAAGVCGRCHVISVVEWGISGHGKGATDCVACHGVSDGHVIDERNNIKPERIPRDAAIGGLCATCHKAGCPKSKQTANCQNCHHAHALLNPNKPLVPRDDRYEELNARWQRYSRAMEQGEAMVKAQKWGEAHALYETALKERPGDPPARERLKMTQRRLNPAIPGFESAGSAFDERTGLPREVRVAGLGIGMVLVPGGQFEMGTDRIAKSKPIHTQQVGSFYLAKFEVTQAEWKALMGTNPSAHQGAKYPEADRMPVEQVSWQDCQALIQKLNERVPGQGFRLPNEAEWEMAARAGDGAVDSVPQRATSPVGKGQPNRLGLFDMIGNVWEWTSSGDKPYPFAANDGREDPAAPGLRILRGGGYADLPLWLSPGGRFPERINRRLPWNGVRIARTVPGE